MLGLGNRAMFSRPCTVTCGSGPSDLPQPKHGSGEQRIRHIHADGRWHVGVRAGPLPGCSTADRTSIERKSKENAHRNGVDGLIKSK